MRSILQKQMIAYLSNAFLQQQSVSITSSCNFIIYVDIVQGIQLNRTRLRALLRLSAKLLLHFRLFFLLFHPMNIGAILRYPNRNQSCATLLSERGPYYRSIEMGHTERSRCSLFLLSFPSLSPSLCCQEREKKRCEPGIFLENARIKSHCTVVENALSVAVNLHLVSGENGSARVGRDLLSSEENVFRSVVFVASFHRRISRAAMFSHKSELGHDEKKSAAESVQLADCWFAPCSWRRASPTRRDAGENARAASWIATPLSWTTIAENWPSMTSQSTKVSIHSEIFGSYSTN